MSIWDVFTGDSAKEAAEENTRRLQQNQTTGTATLQGGQTGALGALSTAGGYYKPLADKYGGGTNLYLDSLGVNGAGGNTRATQAFQAGPGYQYAVDQALDGINRHSAAGGGPAPGGNTLAALGDRAGNMANQEYGNWQSRLAGLIQPEMAATTGLAGMEAAKAPVYTGTANSIANLGTNTTTGVNDQNTQAANAEMQGSKNLWGFGLNAATALATGGTSLLGGGLSGLGGMFGGGGQTMANPYAGMPKVGSGW